MRAIETVTARMGGVEIVVHPSARRRVRRAARAASVVVGYAAGIASVTCAVVAVAQSALVWPVVVCGGVAASVAWRCRK